MFRLRAISSRPARSWLVRRALSASPGVRSWAQAVTKAEVLVQPAEDDPTAAAVDRGDIRKLASDHLAHLTSNLRNLVQSEHPMLTTMGQYYFDPNNAGKHFRPLLVLLMSLATSRTPHRIRVNATTDYYEAIDRPVSTLFGNTYYTTNFATSPQPSTSFYDHRCTVDPQSPRPPPPTATGSPADPSAAPATNSGQSPPLPFAPGTPEHRTMYQPTAPDTANCVILPSQRRLAEIVELMHTATLLHDDVVDEAAMRRAKTCAHLQFGNKMAILVGDFLIARACCALTRLRHNEVTELLATVISDLTEGEVMQLKNSESEAVTDRRNAATQGDHVETTTGADGPTAQTFAYYLQKSYLKTASLIAKSCRAAALLGGCTPEVADQAYSYGKNLGLAFQLIDDRLDFTVSEAELGKPAGADLNLGLATAPVLYAWQEFPELGPLVRRKFAGEGDARHAWQLVHQSQGLAKTFDLAREHCDTAIASLMTFPESPARQALVDITTRVLERKK
ncbi:coq1 putative hexaprenyl diphosphate synthase [Tieghemiomyces parasiticus]|uniref:Coq1 putative hexaprenyl diphosphate synthase n=1 Tax=Tieghemiomyces parasiticus TaxID=78921 RepID=A0A9W7ZJ01_9FUNG|nr:coq1 putative hexaprenyl diphosphate synthase [Tieghemiomyces parasiticus]